MDGATAKVWTKLLRLSMEEERDELKDNGWNAAPGSDANWSSLVNNSAENDSKYDFSLFPVELGSTIMAEKLRWSQSAAEKNPSHYHGKNKSEGK